MKQTLTSLLVGAHFRPPAQTVLSHLPTGTQLLLEPDPENPYDAAAIRVLVDPAEIPESEHEALDEELLACGQDLALLLFEPFLWLGFVASSDGKPLHQSLVPGLKGNKEFLPHQPSEGQVWTAELAFAPGGEPLVRLTV